MGYDLFFRDGSGRARSHSRSSAVVEALAAVEAIGRLCNPRSAYSEPDDLDTGELTEMLEEDGDTEVHLQRFCLASGIDPTTATVVPAHSAAFLDHLLGPAVATITLPRPEAEVRDIYQQCVSFAAANGLHLWDPQAGRDIDLDVPGHLPPLWK